MQKLIPELETIVSQYADPETYLTFIRYNPKLYTLLKYESLMADIIEKRLDLQIKCIEESKDNSHHRYWRKNRILFDTLLFILLIMKQLDIINYEDNPISLDNNSIDNPTIDIVMLQKLNSKGTYKQTEKDLWLEIPDDKNEFVNDGVAFKTYSPLFKSLNKIFLLYKIHINTDYEDN